MAKVKIQIVPTEGAPSNKEQTLPQTGASLEQVLEKAEISTKNKDYFVNGEPAKLNTHVDAKDAVKVVDVKVVERPQGS